MRVRVGVGQVGALELGGREWHIEARHPDDGRFEREEDARASAASLVGCKLEKIFESRAVQVPGLYPSSTTMRILAIAADELNIKPAEAQDHLNAMYQEGGHE